MRERARELLADKGSLEESLRSGNERARAIASRTYDEVAQLVGFK